MIKSKSLTIKNSKRKSSKEEKFNPFLTDKCPICSSIFLKEDYYDCRAFVCSKIDHKFTYCRDYINNKLDETVIKFNKYKLYYNVGPYMVIAGNGLFYLELDR